MTGIIDLFRELGLSPIKKTAKEWASPCPFCGGTDRCSIWPEKQGGIGYYWCRQCNAEGNGIQLQQDAADISHKERV